MNPDPRLEGFLHAVRTDLRDLFPASAADERLLEIRGHLLESVSERQALGSPDPVGDALAEFGQSDGYRMVAHADPRLARLAERSTLRWAAALLVVPVLADLAMDASSWITGSESGLWGIGIPLLFALSVGFSMASARCRRFLAAPLLGMTLGAFGLFAVLGGWTRATSHEGTLGTQSRGTAFRRRESLIESTLPEARRVAERLEKGAVAFAGPHPSSGVGPFRTAEGYVVPRFVGRDKAERYAAYDIRYETVTDYGGARRQWQQEGPTVLLVARRTVQAYRAEIDELALVATCPWGRSVRAELDAKVAMGLTAGASLLVMHGLGVVFGTFSRRRRDRRLA